MPLIDFAAADATTLCDWFTVLSPHLRRWLIATVDWRHILPLETAPPSGLRFVRFGVWLKPNGAPQFTGDRPGTGWEAIAMLHRDSGRMHWNGGGRTAVFTRNKVNSDHPAGKPLPLLREFVHLFTDAGETVLDPFMGSGTTLRACKDLGRNAIGIEVEEKYCQIAAQRLSQEAMQFEVPA